MSRCSASGRRGRTAPERQNSQQAFEDHARIVDHVWRLRPSARFDQAFVLRPKGLRSVARQVIRCVFNSRRDQRSEILCCDVPHHLEAWPQALHSTETEMNTIATVMTSVILAASAFGATAQTAKPKDAMAKDHPTMTMQQCKDYMGEPKKSELKREESKDKMCADMMKNDSSAMKDKPAEPMKK
jgi:hypothetical protein